jgi:wobble nucleotide-excising tRNase
MVKKLIRLRNIGRFHHCECNLELGDFNLVFAENGAGKTTLAAVMHSIAREEPGFITERATVDSGGDPRVQLLSQAHGSVRFEKGSWKGSTSSVLIDVFDSHFVNENIYSGDTLSHDHKKRLHRFVIGERGRDLSKRIDQIDALSRKLQQHIRSIEARIRDLLESNLSVDEFLALSKSDDVGDKIDQVRKRLRAQKKASELRAQDDLGIPELPEIPIEEIRDLLSRSLDEVADDAESVVAAHISDCMDDQGESWVQHGLSYVKDGACPFCGRNLSGIDLVTAYRDYFNDEYEALKEDVKQKHYNLKSRILTQDGWRKVTSVVDSNQSRFELWKDHIDAQHKVPDNLKNEIEKAWTQLRASLDSLFEKKRAAPLEPVELSDRTEEAWNDYKALSCKLQAYEQAVIRVNEEICEFKKDLGTGSPDELEEELAQLTDSQQRHSDQGASLAERLRLNRRRKERIFDAKEEVKDELTDFQSDVLASCQTRINSFLRKAGATFRIREAEVGYQGGTANARFSLEVNEREIGIGNAVTEVGKQSFRNLLSEGDKTTLAFAFFYARMQEADDLSDHVIVIDDPISSLDEHRRNATRDAILNLAEKAGQIMVLSHNPRFLASLLRRRDAKDAHSELFHIQKTGGKESELCHWEERALEKMIQSPYYRHFDKLVAYASNRDGDPHDVAHSIRHVLEGNLRQRFPDKYARKDGSIGSFIGKVDEADGDNPLSDLQHTPYFEELKSIANSDYCHDPHHDDAPYMPSPINETELAVWVERTIRFARGLPSDH